MTAIVVYSVTLQPAAGGLVRTLATGNGTPPATLATLDPATLVNGNYAITITATAGFGSAQQRST